MLEELIAVLPEEKSLLVFGCIRIPSPFLRGIDRNKIRRCNESQHQSGWGFCGNDLNFIYFAIQVAEHLVIMLRHSSVNYAVIHQRSWR